MNEATFTTQFNHWLVRQNFPFSAVFELKITKSKSLPFTAVQPHQARSLRAAKRGRLIYKIPDVGLGQKPFDCFHLYQTKAFVVVFFYRPRQYNKFYLIDIDDFCNLKDSCGRKSLTEAMAEAHGIAGALDNG